MTRLEQLEMDALKSRQQLAGTISQIRSKLTPDALAAESLKGIDSRLPLLKKLESAAKRHPLLAAGILAGASFLIQRAIRTPRGTRHSSSASTLHKL